MLLACAATLCVVAPAVQAATQQPWVARHYDSTNGMPVNSARSAVIDSDGFLWLATQDGLARFDGEHFDVYDSMRAPALSNNRIMGLYKDSAGHVYAMTSHGDFVSVSFRGIERVKLGEKGPENAIWVDRHSMCVTTPVALHCPDGTGAFPVYVRFPAGVNATLALRADNGTVWLMSRENDIWLYRNGAWRKLALPGVPTAWWPPSEYALDRDGDLWTKIRERALRVAPSGDFRYFASDADPVGITQIRRSPDGNVWLGAGNGVYVIRNGRPQRVIAAPRTLPFDAYQNWRAPDGALWVAHKCQLWRVTQSAHAQAMLPAPLLQCKGTIEMLLFGPGKLVWVITRGDGIYRLNRERVDMLDRESGLPGDNVYSVARDADDTMWLGTLGSGLLAVSTDGSIKHYGLADGLPGPNPWLVAIAPDGSIYVGSYAPGVWWRAPGTQGFRRVALPAELKNAYVHAVTFDADGTLWIGTTAGAWRRRHGQWQRMWPTSPRPVSVNDIAITDHGVWFATDQGVWFRRGEITHAVAAKLLANIAVRNLRFTRDGALWISTVGHGLVRVAADDPLGLHPLQLGRAQGLPSNSPHTIREDAADDIWVNSNQGIFRISPDDLNALMAGQRNKLSPLVLGRSDGLTVLEGNGGVQPAAARDAQGRLWFPSQAGVARFDPDAIRPRGQPPHPLITDMQSEGRDVTLTADGSLPLGVRSLRFVYDAANLFGSGKSRFRYRLLPQSKEWIATTAVRSAVFSGLSPGQYRFEIVAANSDGIWTRKPTVFEFEVLAYWYETTAFRIAAAVMVLLLLILLVQWRLSRMRRRAKVLSRQVQERTRELKQANIALERAASHDFLTDLPNRRAFVESIDGVIAGGRPLALAIIDLDYFKAYNDELGHLAGDRCLVQFAALLKAQGAMPGILASRVGGEEFALLFEGEEVQTAGDILDALVNALHDLELRHPASAAGDRISFSAGLAVRRSGDKRAEDLFQRADDALYRAKGAGRNCWRRAE